MKYNEQCLDETIDCVYIREVNYYETDMMKVVHHSNYIRWFEEARTYLLDCLGYPYAKIEEQGVMIPVLSVSCDYKLPCRFGEKVSIITKLVYYNGVRMKLCYEIWDEAHTGLRVTGTSAHCFVDTDFRPVSIKKKLPEMHEIFMNTLKDAKKA
ncbi:MAG: acyl-CoA thioesterase [Lachnospiraceae bacterium]|nr:acyl-CoA thioesterase [Lachnospiraceae bacterium]